MKWVKAGGCRELRQGRLLILCMNIVFFKQGECIGKEVNIKKKEEACFNNKGHFSKSFCKADHVDGENIVYI